MTSPQVIEGPDRVHVLTRRYEWTIMRRASGGRGPCYISDIRRRGSGKQIIRDGGPPFSTVNDPRYGGLFGFGVIVARPPDPPDPATFWNWCHELSTHHDGSDTGPAPGYGVAKPIVSAAAAPTRATVDASCLLILRGTPIATLTWSYIFTWMDAVTCRFEVAFNTAGAAGLYGKEPKITANGFTGGYRYLTVLDENGKVGRPEHYDLRALDNPHLQTKQIDWPRRATIELSRGGVNRDTVRVSCDRGLEEWADALEGVPSFSDQEIHPDGSFGPSPRYCMPKGVRLRQWEAPHWPKVDAAGVLFHLWEGGYGAPACWDTFGPWPPFRTVYATRLRCVFP